MTRISAGSYDLNRWLHGGYESDIVSVLYGASGTGKTNFCILAAVSQAKKGGKVIFIDSEGGFSIERVKQMLGMNNDQDGKDALNFVLENILLLKPTNFDEQIDSFKKLLQYLKNEVSLIIVDGMTMLYRIDFATARERSKSEMDKINSELVNQIRSLAEIARKNEIPVIITNQVYNWKNNEGLESKMVGGDILRYWSKCHIELVNEKGKRVAYLRKHRSLPEKELSFQIVNEGIKKKGWI